jgi:hypothetical protein
LSSSWRVMWVARDKTWSLREGDNGDGLAAGLGLVVGLEF